MFSMAVAAIMRRHRIAAAAALAAALIAPGAAAAAAAAPAAQASVSSSAAASSYGGSWAGNAALNWAEGHAAGCWYSYGGTSCSPGYDCSGLVMEALGHAAGKFVLPTNSVGAKQLQKSSVTGLKVKNGTLTAADFVLATGLVPSVGLTREVNH